MKKLAYIFTFLVIFSTCFLVNFMGENSKFVMAQGSVLNFPEDHGSHEKFAAEWWYLNLLVKGEELPEGNTTDLGYVLSFSRIARRKALLSSRYNRDTGNFEEETNVGGDLSVYLENEEYLNIIYTNGETTATLAQKPGTPDGKRVYMLKGETPQIGHFELILKERTVAPSGYNRPLLWGGTTGDCKGQISVFGPDDTYYYSIPDLDISGTITDIDGIEREVKIGKAWIDHQWFNNSPPNDWKGHYWTSFHFTHSPDLYNNDPHQAIGYVTQIYEDGPRYTYWVRKNKDGTNECGEAGTIKVERYGATNYPALVSLGLEKAGTNFLNTTGYVFSDNQTFDPPAGPDFFEPVTFFRGHLNDESFTGLGFFETHLQEDDLPQLPLKEIIYFYGENNEEADLNDDGVVNGMDFGQLVKSMSD